MKEKFTAKMWFGIFILALSGASIYLLPYMRWTYYDILAEACGLTNTQMGVAAGVYGVTAMIFYAVGGIVADRYSSRKILTIGLGATGLLGLWFATYPGYLAQMVIYGLWGVFSTLTFWAAMMKETRNLGNDEQQGRLFGFVEGGRGLLTSLMSFLFLFILSRAGENAAGLRIVILGMTVACLITAVLIWFFLEDDSAVEKEAKAKATGKDILQIIKTPAVWYITLVIFCCYSAYLGSTYMTPYMTSIIGISAALAGVFSVVRGYVVQFFCGPIGGIIADRIHSVTKVVLYTFVIMTIAMIVILFVPGTSGTMILLFALIIVFCAAVFAMRGVYFATVGEANIPYHLTGTVVGIASVVGFMPDVFMSAFYGNLLDRFEGIAGYRAIFITMLVLSAVGLLASILLVKNLKKGKKNV